MATIGGDVTEEITNEVDLFGSIMQQNVLENEFNREYAPLASMQPGAAIEFRVTGSNDLYLDLNNSRLHVLAKITKADRTNIDANTTAPINLTLHSMFREIGVELNSRNVGDTSQLYPYRSFVESLLNFSKETQETRLLCEGWTKDTTGQVNVTAVGGNNAGLNARAVNFARSAVVELIGRHNANVFHQDRLIPPNIDLNLKLMPSPNNFVCKSAAPSGNEAQENFKLVIISSNLIINTKQLTSKALKTHMELFQLQNMRHHLSRVQMKHITIPANQTSINFDNVYTGALPDLVIVGLVRDADLAGGYQRNSFNFRNFGVNRIEMKHNCTSVPRGGYTPNFANGQYLKAYSTLLQELECDTGDKSISLTPSEWANGYTLYAFKITDIPIGSGTYGPRSKSTTGSARLEVSFAAPVSENIKVVVYYQSPGKLEFDQSKAVLVL